MHNKERITESDDIQPSTAGQPAAAGLRPAAVATSSTISQALPPPPPWQTFEREMARRHRYGGAILLYPPLSPVSANDAISLSARFALRQYFPVHERSRSPVHLSLITSPIDSLTRTFGH